MSREFFVRLRRINSEYGNAGAVDFERIAIDDGRLTDQVISERGSR
jgi:hypothetical protein